MKKILKGFTAVIFAAMFSATVFAGPVYNGHTYFLTSGGLGSWAAAEAEAIASGGNLVAINDAAEQAYLVSEFGGVERLWIGLTDAASEGTFGWSNGDAVTYLNWAAGEPNNLGNEDFTVMNWSGPGNWNDCPLAGCGGHRGIIEVVPEPSTLAVLGISLIGLGIARRRRA